MRRHAHPDLALANCLLTRFQDELLEAVAAAEARRIPLAEAAVLVATPTDTRRYTTSPPMDARLQRIARQADVAFFVLPRTRVRSVLFLECPACAAGFRETCDVATTVPGSFAIHFDLAGIRFSGTAIASERAGDA